MTPSGRLPVFDFPEWLGAITVRELRAGLAARDMVFLLILTQVGLAFAGIYAVLWSSISPRDAEQMLRAVLYIAGALGLLVQAPARALRSLNGDRDSGLLGLLQLTAQTSGRIVLGKWISGAIQSALFVVTLLPYVVLRFFVGGADLVSEGVMVATVFAASLAIQAVCLLLSTLPRALRGLGSAALIVGCIAAASDFVMRFRFGAGFSNAGYGGFAVLLFACITVLSLLAAAQAIASPAENYVARFRLALAGSLLAVLGLAARLLDAVLRFPGRVENLVVVAVVFAGVVACFEFAAPGNFVPAQVPVRARRAPWRNLWIGFLLPGWRSAACFYSLLFVLLTLATLPFPSSDVAVRVAQMFVAILVPRVFLELLRFRSRESGLLPMLGIHAVLLVLGVSIVAISRIPSFTLVWPQYVPGIGLWTSTRWGHLPSWTPWPPLIWIGVLGAFLIWRGRDERKRANAAVLPAAPKSEA